MFGELRQLHDPTPQTEGKWVYGAWLATARLIREFLRDGLVDALDCFAPTGRTISEIVEGRECREIPFTSFPREAQLNRYETLFSYFGWNSGLPSLRARILPHASHVQVVHSMHYERTLWDFGCNLYWETAKPYDAIVCTSRTSLRTLHSMIAYWLERGRSLRRKKIEYPATIVEIPLGVDLPAARPDQQRARALLGWGQDKLVVLVVGRLAAFDKMDHGSILALIGQLKSIDRLQFVFAGEDTQHSAKKLTRIAQSTGLADRLRIYSNFGFDLRETLYSAADIFYSPADHLQETFGLTVLEAMAHALPVVASDWGGYRDLVQHGRTGLLIPTFWGGRIEDFSLMASIDAMTSSYEVARRTVVDSGAAKQAIVTLAENDGLRRSMGLAGHQRVKAHFTWPTVVSQYRELWDELADIRSKHGSKSLANDAKLPLPRGHDYRRIFGHYPTRELHKHDRVATPASFAEARRTNPIFFLSYEEEQAAINTILAVIEKKPLSVEQCCRRVARRLALPAKRVQDHLLLAAKYGLIEISSNTRMQGK
jgi:glycosyltransferase involved in cell wall biosynthesis